MTTGLTYNSYVAQMSVMAVVPAADVNFVAILPSMITYAENRICRDIDFLFTVNSKNYLCTANLQTIAVPDTDFITLQEINIITPSGTTNPELGTRNPCLPVTKEYLRFIWPSAAGAAMPTVFCWVDNETVRFGPWPDQTYTAEVVGTSRPASLSATVPNQTTFISTYMPDLFIMASMIYITAFQRNFGKMSDDPEMGPTYETQYKALLEGVDMEEARKKFQGPAWSPMSPAKNATPTR